ncbi:hypothetical protein G6011_03642 [Alternaria panax]|uniref:Protein kinase domain-containing protein n=1 Tax=Alternaria panax TaxID=48097 RepID=A0AAD4IFI0_9PLEO|nr:hypothetical protein G6011_03642 [Alternaria panax]
MDLDSVYEETNKQYISLHEAGRGMCGKVTFCIRTPSSAASPPTIYSTAQSSAIVAIKTPTRRMSRNSIAAEIIALRRAHSLFGAEDKTVAKHLPNLIDFDLIKDGESRWLAVHPIRGFDLEQLRVVITHMVQLSPSTSATFNLPFPAIPEVLVLQIAKQLTETIGWLHDVANIAHNDVFGGNVMLDMSAWNNESGFTMPTIVLIDFNRASLNPTEREKGADHSSVYELTHMLDSTGRAISQRMHAPEDSSTPKRSPTWSDVFMNFLNISKDQYLQEESSTFAQFRERFGADIDRRLVEVTEEEVGQVQELLDMIVEKEVRFPSEDRIREVLVVC